ncbi:MAG: RelA/SpoT family protein [Candidatus Peregrinibacteria bacterium]|nr:RelA/SpoT family protein [Candidatus Peregrinibacteria bacterium]
MIDKKHNFEKDLRSIIKCVAKYYPGLTNAQKERIKKAFHYSQKAHEGQLRASGEPYFLHPVEATKIVCSIRPDIETIEASLLHDVIEDTPITAKEIEKEFGTSVRFLCEGVEKVAKIRLEKNQSQKFENLQKLFIAVAKDIRVTFIKLADRIHNLQTLEHVPKKKRERIALESKEIYSHVAGKLGLFEFRNEILDLSLKHLHPNEFSKIDHEIKSLQKTRKETLDLAKKEILEAGKKFPGKNFKIIDIHSRQKNLHSVYGKLKRKNLHSAHEIFDLFGIRILVRSQEDCYKMLGILHSNWNPIPGRFKDYISVPKPNGYQALHTTILGIGKSSLPTEIQIKTEKMHLDAEFGPAAHWAYKKTKASKFDEDYVKRTKWFHQNIPLEKQEDPEKFFNEMADAIMQHRIYVFTPEGDIKTLVAGATAVDFAYAIHTKVGETCVGAKVNGEIKPLDYKLKNGQVIEIMNREGRKPNPLWLKFVKSSHAINNIKSFVNQQKAELKSEYPDVKVTPRLLHKKEQLTTKVEKIKSSFLPRKKYDIVIGSEHEIPYKLAHCCQPAPGKDIVAYKSRGLHFTIHESDCKELSHLEPNRFCEASFSIEFAFNIKAHDKIGLLYEYTKIISAEGINIGDSKFLYDKKNKTSNATFVVECRSRKEFKNLIHQLRKLPNVISVTELTKK